MPQILRLCMRVSRSFGSLFYVRSSKRRRSHGVFIRLYVLGAVENRLHEMVIGHLQFDTRWWLLLANCDTETFCLPAGYHPYGSVASHG